MRGKFVSEWFADKGRALRPGAYVVEITSPMAALQPREVQKVIGEMGRFLSGRLVRVDDFGKHVAFSKTVTLK